MSYRITDFDQYKRDYDLSVQNPESFWENVAENFTWDKKWTKVQSGNFSDANIKWFENGKLNITNNCLDRHIPTKANDLALLFIANSPEEIDKRFTFKELLDEVSLTANMLKAQGVQKGDRVILYMSMVPELLISVLACARIGAVHSVVFGGFSAQALAGRIEDAEAKLIITNDGGYRGDKIIPLKNIVDEALLLEGCESVEKVIVHKRVNNIINMSPERDVDWDAAREGMSLNCPAESMDAEDTLFTLYTSGSTGKPKGIKHTVAGYMVWAAYTFENVFQVEENDLYWCTADIGWITGHSYITYGPLLNGKSTVMFEGVPTYPDASRFWQIVEKYKITHFYTAPTAIRALMGCGDEFVEKNDLSSLKVIGSVGEPINDEAWHWYNEKVGKKKCPIVDTWWQTETGGIMISPLANITKLKPCFATLPLPGVRPVLLDEKGQEITSIEAEGNLCMKHPWPGVVRSIWGDHERYKQTYFSTYPGYYFTGDGCRRDSEGFFRITGRVDDVINVSGHRIGTAEVEDAIDQHHDVIEAAVVGYPHDIKGQGIYAFVMVSKNATEKIKEEIIASVVKYIGPIAKPDKIQIVKGLPKTRSGKIMRRILRKIAAAEFDSFGDISTLLDPEVVEEIKSGAILD
ncbi:acetate--CoA ligase [Bacteriovorax sp. Seq25_V]|uniref:acetate--CoA ligase n=1 Tax=Bacteriovorax sp. Seq25_V TaxID=1201288 RepID=UPI000389E11B|nr:acetate--CoA ligase [Bacteriovorax sp. Seq25_V]EQC45596.1 acetate--CoA ligase [Bacteriovorax sp. Seq25_V]